MVMKNLLLCVVLLLLVWSLIPGEDINFLWRKNHLFRFPKSTDTLLTVIVIVITLLSFKRSKPETPTES